MSSFIRILACVLLGAGFIQTAWSAIYKDFDDWSTLAYDFIVIGGGTAGNVIANRLTEDVGVTVLVLEAGGSDAISRATPPLLAGSLAPFTPSDWNYTTTPQAGLNGRSIPYPRGFLLGGSSSINYMLYTRGSSDDYNRYAKLTGDPGLSWNNIQPYIRKNEKFVAPNDHHNTAGQFDPVAHSTTGMVSVSLPGFPWPEDPQVIETTRETAFSSEFPFNEDTNTGNVIGVGWAQATIGQGHRSSSATSYLGPSFINRPNLHVLLNARATKILQTGSSKEYPIFQSVEFTTGTDEKAPRVTASARHEIVLCAGSFNSPQLLMLSGIGDSAELAAVGIEQIVENRAVGKNMSDHVLLSNAWFANTNESYETFTRDPAVLSAQANFWNKTGTGPLSYTVADVIGWLRLPNNSSAFDDTADPSPGPHSAHYELIFSNGFILGPTPATGNYFGIATNVISPTSRGTISLRSTNPFDPPLINPNLLGSSFDIATVVAALRAAQRFVTSRAMSSLVMQPFGTFADVYNGTDAQLSEYARDNSGTVFHAVGTASMGPVGDKTGGAVDPKFRLKGALGLRVVDASVIPIVPSAHTQVPVYIFAERAADLIRETWKQISSIEQYPM